VAVKEFNLITSSSTPSTTNMFIQEVKTLASIGSSPYVVKLIGAGVKAVDQLFIVMEFIEGGNVSDLLRNTATEITWKVKLQMLNDIVMGIHTLHTHEPQILHRDLKPANILVIQHSDGYHCKLADFGIAKFQQELTTNITPKGTMIYMAPELLQSKPNYSTKSDIYSLGIIIWEVGARKRYMEEAISDVIPFLIQKGDREDDLLDGPMGFMELVHKCWDQDPSKRPEAVEVLDELAKIAKSIDIEDVSKQPEAGSS